MIARHGLGVLLIFSLLTACNPLGDQSNAALSYTPGLNPSSPSPASPSSSSLSGLTMSAGTLSPVFSSTTTSYTVSVVNTVSSITISPNATNSSASVVVNGSSVPSGTSGTVPLSAGNNTIPVVVTSPDTTSTTTYTLVVRRMSNISSLSALSLSSVTLSPSFVATTTSYSSTVVNSTTSTTVTPVATQANATITVDGAAVNSGATSGSLSLPEGMNYVNVVCTSEDGTSTTTYQVVLNRTGAIRAAHMTSSSVTLSWSLSSGSGLTYKLYMSSAEPTYGSFSTLLGVTGGTLVATLTDTGSATVSSGITAGNWYYFNVVVRDTHGNQALYGQYGEYFSSATNQVYWPFNNDSVDIFGSNDGIRTNSPTAVSDRFGYASSAWHFTSAPSGDSAAAAGAVAPYINSTNSLGNAGAISQTISFWMSVDSVDNNVFVPMSAGQEYMSQNSKFGFYWNGSPSLATAWGGDFNTSSELMNTLWNHWLLTYDGTTLTAYQNGTSIGSNTVTMDVINSPIAINWASYFLGNYTGTFAIDEVRYWNASLSSTQVGYLYNATRP